MLSYHFSQNFFPISSSSWLLKFFFFSLSNVSASLKESFRTSANLFPNMLFAITLFPNPVYPGNGSFNFTYYLPSLSTTLLFGNWFDLFFISSFQCSSFTSLNWLTSDPLDPYNFGFVKKYLYFLNFYLFVWDSNNVGCCPAKHFRGCNISGCLSAHVFVFWLKILSLHIMICIHIRSYFAVGGSKNILRFYGMNKSTITFVREELTRDMWSLLFFFYRYSFISTSMWNMAN